MTTIVTGCNEISHVTFCHLDAFKTRSRLQRVRVEGTYSRYYSDGFAIPGIYSLNY